MQVEIKTQEELSAFIADQAKPVVLVVTADWCGPCKLVKPALQSLSDEKSFRLGMVNGGSNKELAQALKVRSVPTMIVFRNGDEVGRFAGNMNREQLRASLGRFGAV